MKKRFKTLEALLAHLKTLTDEQVNEIDLAMLDEQYDLPFMDGEMPFNDRFFGSPIWAWDDMNVITGGCIGDMVICRWIGLA